jgi:N4-(beta-N-acetylglucosaminyl)-L-asparaginase
MNRRSFIKSTGVASLGIGLNIDKTFSASNNSIVNPIVIATWDVKNATKRAWEILSANGNSLDAVEMGCKVEEANKDGQSVGIGGLPDREGNVTLDACIMDHNGNCGSVVYLKDIKHAISVARLVMEKTPHVMLAGDGAKKFAISMGFKKENLLTEKSKKDWIKWKENEQYKPIINIENHDTIGMLAIDKNKNISGGCTTSGLAYKMQGRVGDSPIIGSGLFIDNEIGGAVATGLGEEVLKTVGSFLVVELMRQGYSPDDACKIAIKRIVKKPKSNFKNFQVGYIALNKNGETGSFSIQKGFSMTQYDKKGNININSPYYYKQG